MANRTIPHITICSAVWTDTMSGRRPNHRYSSCYKNPMLKPESYGISVQRRALWSICTRHWPSHRHLETCFRTFIVHRSTMLHKCDYQLLTWYLPWSRHCVAATWNLCQFRDLFRTIRQVRTLIMACHSPNRSTWLTDISISQAYQISNYQNLGTEQSLS